MLVNLFFDKVVALRRAVLVFKSGTCRLAAKAVQRASLSLQGVHHVHGSDGFSLGVLTVRDRVADNVLQENFENSAGFFVDETGDTLDSSAAGQPTYGRFCDALDVVAKNFAVPLGAPFSKTLRSFATARHVCARLAQL